MHRRGVTEAATAMHSDCVSVCGAIGESVWAGWDTSKGGLYTTACVHTSACVRRALRTTGELGARRVVRLVDLHALAQSHNRMKTIYEMASTPATPRHSPASYVPTPPTQVSFATRHNVFRVCLDRRLHFLRLDLPAVLL